jgi:2'-5' RNA ligase
MNSHQLKQKAVIDKIQDQVNDQNLKFTTVSPTEDYEGDSRKCLTSVHLPRKQLIDQILEILINPLRKLEPNFYYYSEGSLHTTIKNIRVINDPPRFTEKDVVKAKEVFSRVIPRHQSFNVDFYRLLLFPNSLSLIGVTDSELDNIIFDLDEELTRAGIPDDKVYANSKYFFSNITLCRFNGSCSEEFKKKVVELSNSLEFKTYLVDSVVLLSSSAILRNQEIFGMWKLQPKS